MDQVSERGNGGDQARAIEGIHLVLDHGGAVSEPNTVPVLG